MRDRIEFLEFVLRSHSIDIDQAAVQYQTRNGPPAGKQDEGTQSSAQFEELCAAFEGTLSLDESVNFDGDGECHYFGPTSGRLGFQDRKLYFQSTSAILTLVVPDTSQHTHIISKDGLGTPADILMQSEASPDYPNSCLLHVNKTLQAELIDLYFVWQNPWFPVLDEMLFRSHLQQGGGRYFSPLLLSCVLAAGSRFSERHEIRTNPIDPDTAGDDFLAEAEVLLHFDLKSPSFTTIQAAAIMIYMYIVSFLGPTKTSCGLRMLVLTELWARGADAIAWLHQGTAHRLALDMGLNFDGTSGLGSMTTEETALRRQIYWALYCTDKLHAIYSGRVCTMLVSSFGFSKPTTLVSIRRLIVC